MRVYKIGNNNYSATKRNVMVTIETVPDLTDNTDLEDASALSSKLISATYYPSKINIGKIISIVDLENNEEFEFCYFNRVKYTVNCYFKISGYSYDITKAIKDKHYLSVFKSRDGALNESYYVNSYYTGIKLYHYPNGKILMKKYFSIGKLRTLTIYYNNQTNSIKHEIIINRHPVKETVYDTRGYIATKYIFNESGKISGSESFFKTILPSYYQEHTLPKKRLLRS